MFACLLHFFLALCLCPTSRAAAKDDSPIPDSFPDLFHHYVSRPDIEAPRWHIQVYNASALDDDDVYWFVSPYKDLFQKENLLWIGAYIYRPDGELVWTGAPSFDYSDVSDFRVSQYSGRPVLSYLSHRATDAANAFILDDTYTVIRALDTTPKTLRPNMHEFNLVHDGKSGLVVISPNYSSVSVDIGGYKGDCRVGWQGFQEVDIETAQPIFRWNAIDHLGYEESSLSYHDGKYIEEKCSDWDFEHFNSVDLFDNGDYLLSVRHANTLYRISPNDSSVVWRLGGTHSDFEFQSDDAAFSEQHHARIVQENATHVLLSVFDNAFGAKTNLPATRDRSAGLLLELQTDVKPMTAKLVQHFPKPEWPGKALDHSPWSAKRGSVSVLPNGNIFIGWSFNSHISEHSPDGQLLMQALFMRDGIGSYRSYKMPWVGRPAEPPDVVANVYAEKNHVHTTVHMSWNGATEVRSWDVLYHDQTTGPLRLLSSVPCWGFETNVTFPGYARAVVAVARDKRGDELGRSKPVEAAVQGKIDPALLLSSSVEVFESSNAATKEQSSQTVMWLLSLAGFALGEAIFAVYLFRKWRATRPSASYRALPAADVEDVDLEEFNDEPPAAP